MNFKWTVQSKQIFEELKKEVILNFENKEPTKKIRKFTKKKEFLIIPIPYQSPAFQLFIDGKFYGSFFYKNNEWVFLK
jgi:hypothetical protein